MILRQCDIREIRHINKARTQPYTERSFGFVSPLLCVAISHLPATSPPPPRHLPPRRGGGGVGVGVALTAHVEIDALSGGAHVETSCAVCTRVRLAGAAPAEAHERERNDRTDGHSSARASAELSKLEGSILIDGVGSILIDGVGSILVDGVGSILSGRRGDGR